MQYFCSWKLLTQHKQQHILFNFARNLDLEGLLWVLFVIQLIWARDSCSQRWLSCIQRCISCSRVCISCIFQKRPHIPPMPLFTGVPRWGTYFEFPHSFPIYSPFFKTIAPNGGNTTNRLKSNKIFFTARVGNLCGMYGEPRKGFPPLNPFIHRHSERFVGNGEHKAYLKNTQRAHSRTYLMSTFILFCLHHVKYCISAINVGCVSNVGNNFWAIGDAATIYS